MPHYRSLTETYDRCVAEGSIIPKAERNIEIAKANLKIAEEDLASAGDILQKKRWNSAYKMHYDVLHSLAEAFLLLDGLKCLSHQALFACLCEKHPELELNWDFFEKVRTKRNGIHYYGTLVSREDWKAIEAQMRVYISTLKKAVEEKIKAL